MSVQELNTVDNRPNLYQGHPTPIDKLSSDAFEDFLSQVLIIWGQENGLEIVGGSLNSGDDGFDITAKNPNDGSTICVQCKRLNSKAVGLALLSQELTKVILNSHINKSDLSGYYLVTSGRITNEIPRIIRSSNREKLIESCQELIKNNQFEKMVEDNDISNPERIIEEVIKSLEKIVVWSGRDLDNQLGVIWGKVDEIIERFFKLEAVIREYPRPDFNYKKYINDLYNSSSEIIELNLVEDTLPKNVNEDIVSTKVGANSKKRAYYSIRDLLINNDEKVSLIIGQGGSGKSKSLEYLQSEIIKANSKEDNLLLPVVIKLGAYRNDLAKLIENELGIRYGHWSSLPYKVVFLLDGLDEVPSNSLAVLSNELSALVKRENIKVILTSRPSGVDLPFSIDGLTKAHKILRLNFSQIRKIIENSEVTRTVELLAELRGNLSADSSRIVSLPFGVVATVKYYKNKGELPKRWDYVIEEIIKDKTKINSDRKSVTLSISTIRNYLEYFAFELRVVQKKSFLYEEEVEEIIISTLEKLREIKVFGINDLNDHQAKEILISHEVIKKEGNNSYKVEHDIIVDYLAAKVLSNCWEEHVETSFETIGSDAWRFAVKYISAQEKTKYISEVLKRDLVLAAFCVIEYSEEGQGLVFEKIIEFSESSSLSDYCKSMMAASILADEKCIEILKDKTKSKKVDFSYNAKRFLAQTGDEETLRGVLEDNDMLVAGGIKVSGGSYDFWFEAPVAVITKIAREQLDGYLEGAVNSIALSLETLKLYGDKEDLERLTEIFSCKGKTLSEFYLCCNALLSICEESAVKLLEEVAYKDDIDEDSIYAMNVLHEIGQIIDTDNLFNVFINHETITTPEMSVFEIITKVISENRLKKNADQELFRINEITKCENKRRFVWEIASNHNLENFKTKFNEYISSDDGSEVLLAIMYADKARLNKKELEYYIGNCKKQVLQYMEQSNYFILLMLVRSLIKHSEREFVAEELKSLIIKTISDYNQYKKLSKEEQKASGFAKYRMYFPDFFICIADVMELLEDDILMMLIGFPIQSSGDEVKDSYINILRSLPRDKVDEAIADIDDKRIKCKNICYLSNLVITEKTKTMLLENMHLMVSHHFFYDELTPLLKLYWSDEVFDRLIQSILNNPWNEVSLRFFPPVMQNLCELVSEAQKRLLNRALTESDGDGLELINLWCEFLRH